MSNLESERIREQMARIRRDLDEDVGAVVDNAKELSDWRGFVKSYPLLTVAVSAAIGFLVVPKRLNVVSPNAEELEKLAKKNRLVVKPKHEVRNQAGVAAPLITLVGGALLRTALTMAGQHLSKAMTGSTETGTSS